MSNIFIVDDEPDLLALVSLVLSGGGHKVVGDATSGKEAVDRLGRLDSSRVDAVVLDYRMPGIDGLETARQIRELHPHAALVLFSAALIERFEEEAQAIGVKCMSKQQLPRLSAWIFRATGARAGEGLAGATSVR